MVTLNKIYTKTGDAGETALGNGVRVPKQSLRVSSYGTVDETNATVGVARLHAEGAMDAQLAMIQNDLFDLGADLCRPDIENDATAEYPPLRATDAQVLRLEFEIDAMNKVLDPLRSFVLTGEPRWRPNCTFVELSRVGLNGWSSSFRQKKPLTRRLSNTSIDCPTGFSSLPALPTTMDVPMCCGFPAPIANPPVSSSHEPVRK